jgi:hypothetical protein
VAAISYWETSILSEVWKTYWPIFERLEQEFRELTYSIALTDAHLVVYSNILSDLLLRSCSECENVGKTLCVEKTLVASPTDAQGLNFPGVGRAICSSIPIEKQELTIIWPYQTLSNPVIRPFDQWSATGIINPNWFNAYNLLKHDRINNATEASLNNVVHALGGLFILNLWLRQEDIMKDHDDVNLINRRVNSYSRFFSPQSFLRPASSDGLSVSSSVFSNRLRNLEFRWK